MSQSLVHEVVTSFCLGTCLDENEPSHSYANRFPNVGGVYLLRYLIASCKLGTLPLARSPHRLANVAHSSR